MAVANVRTAGAVTRAECLSAARRGWSSPKAMPQFKKMLPDSGRPSAHLSPIAPGRLQCKAGSAEAVAGSPASPADHQEQTPENE
jgi:hypothetical protein